MPERILTVVRGAQLMPHICHLRDNGTDPAIVLRKCFCPINVNFEGPNCSIPTNRFWQLVEETALALQDRQTGWNVAIKYGLQGSRHLGYLLENQASLRLALDLYTGLISKHSNSATLDLQVRGGNLWLIRMNTLKRSASFPQVEQYFMGLLVHIVRSYLGAEWQPTQLHVCGKPDPATQHILASNCGELVTGAEDFAIAIPLDGLDQRPNGLPASIKSPGPPATPIPTENREILKEIMHSYLTDYPVTRSSISKILQLHPRTLARLCSKHDLTFSAMKSEVLMERAKVELESGELSIGEVARLLHYSHQSAFTRAFDKHVGMSPQKYGAITNAPS